MTEIYLIRHAESTANIGGLSQPNHKIPLSPQGKKQAQALAEHLTIEAQQIFTSKYQRTQETAAPWLKKIQRSAQIHPLSHEFNPLGFEEIKGLYGTERNPLITEYWQKADPKIQHGEDAESFYNFAERVKNFLNNIKEIKNNSIFFTHGMFMRMIIWQSLNMPYKTSKSMQQFHQFHQFPIENCAIFKLTWQDQKNIAIQKIHTTL